MMTLTEMFTVNQRFGVDALSDHDLAVLADWANEQKTVVVNSDWKRAFALLREGADLLLRRRARASVVPMVPPFQPPAPDPSEPLQVGVTVDYLSLRRFLNDFESTFYGPHSCEHCGVTVVRRALEQGGERYEQRTNGSPEWCEHRCDPSRIDAKPRNNNAIPLSVPQP